ncbi:MAG: GGDEF domain-containing phosphodiesterase [Lachnospiraceae bacterium]|nr:GGDEF domain-containing phosphodiesterase [Lachnospiraceae bacterium]
MFINRLNQLFKPDRILYYMDASEQDIQNAYHGILPEDISRYGGSFGTYDYPGVFYSKTLGKAVIGIEYRADDERVEYPDELKSIALKESFFYSIEIDSDIRINRELVRELFEKIASDDDAHRNYSDLSIKEDPEIIAVFSDEGGDKLRLLYEWKIDDDRAKLIMEDNTELLDKETLYQKAFFDPITGHHNWNHLVPYLEMPRDCGISDYAFAHFDIKQFRIINEVYGHIAANKVLSNVVKAMNRADFIYASARCHNDNFAMMIKDMPQDETIERLEHFFEELSVLEEDPNYRIFYRCGVVPMQRAMLSGNRVADAGKLAQSLGTNPNRTDIIMYNDKIHDDIMWSSYIKAYLDTAIENDEFFICLQPKFDIGSEKIKGAEALIRWNYKGREILSPYRFIPYFEKDGAIGKIDDIVLKKVCRVLSEWKAADKPLCPISVNLSRSRLYDRNLISHLVGIVDSFGVDHGLIDFELTESATYDDTEHMIKLLNELREKGFKISMDDFRTGYSSFSLLTEMPIDTLKIDKSFVDKIGTENDSEKDIAVIRHIISLAGELGFSCLAEGAESRTQVDKLKQLGCSVIQGYYFSKPLPLEEYSRLYV